MSVRPIPKGKMLQVGQDVTPRYTVVGWVGSGGMQDVYVALDRAFDREVCLKSPKNTAAEKRFFRSAKIAARINHPNVAKTLDYIETDDWRFLIEEYVAGRDLKELRSTMPIMDPYMAAHVAHHIVKGLAASHHAGVVHRDIKPSNIIIPDGYDFSSVKVTDFGIATMAEAELSQIDEDTITSSSTMAGALPYMAPEMLRGAKYADMPADVWAVGAMVFEFFCGSKPFGKSFDAVEKIKKGDLPPLPVQKAQFQGIAEELYGLVKKCLVVEPEGRLSADALLTELSSLCYPLHGRVVGTVDEVRYGSQYFARTDDGKAFFHVDSVYGAKPAVGDSVCMTVHAGMPWLRAHPVVRLGG